MSDDSIVLDANILISFHRCDWFDSLSFWQPDYNLLTPESVWEYEFKPYREIEAPPDWLSVKNVRSRIQVDRPGQLSQHDWRVLILARDHDGVVVTSDKLVKERAQDDFGLRVKWSGSFLLDTFQGCGISTEEFQRGVSEYLADSYLPKTVCDEIQSAEKP
jgi:hypothetical protein